MGFSFLRIAPTLITTAITERALKLSPRQLELAGALYSFGAIWSLLSIFVAESLTPGYNVSTEAVSGLGLPYFSGICNTIPTCVTPVEPAAAVFVFSLFLNGVLLLAAGYLLLKGIGHRWFSLGVVSVGVGNLLVGASYIPIYLGATAAGQVGVAYAIHVLGAFVVFILGPVITIAAWRVVSGLFRYFGVGVGAMALVAFVLFVTGNSLGLGYGGMERMIIYPLELWAMGFGVYLMTGQRLGSADRP